MSAFVQVKVDAGKVQESLKRLEITSRESKNAFKRAYRKALNVILKEVRRSAGTVTSDREKIKEGIKLSVWKKGGGGSVSAWRGFKRKKDGRFFTLKWLEEGTKESIVNGRKHGATPAKPFFWAAVESSKDEAARVFEDDIQKELEKAFNKR